MGSDHVELKQLTTRRDETQRRISGLQNEAASLQRKIETERRELSSIDRSINALKERGKDIVISEHAILRYIERVVGMDIEDLKKDILPEMTKLQIKALGNGVFPAQTHKVRVKDNVVITILTNGEK